MGSVTVLQPPGSFDDLPKRKREFVEEFVKTGDAHKAYLAVGYKDSHTSKQKARQLKSELGRHISDAIRQKAVSSDMAILGLSTLERLAKEADSEAVQLNAAKELLLRCMPEGPKEVNINHNVRNMTDDELDRRLKRLRGDLAIDVTPTKA